jgi:hypothetical protein
VLTEALGVKLTDYSRLADLVRNILITPTPKALHYLVVCDAGSGGGDGPGNRCDWVAVPRGLHPLRPNRWEGRRSSAGTSRGQPCRPLTLAVAVSLWLLRCGT